MLCAHCDCRKCSSDTNGSLWSAQLITRASNGWNQLHITRQIAKSWQYHNIAVYDAQTVRNVHSHITCPCRRRCDTDPCLWRMVESNAAAVQLCTTRNSCLRLMHRLSNITQTDERCVLTVESVRAQYGSMTTDGSMSRVRITHQTHPDNFTVSCDQLFNELDRVHTSIK